MNIRPFAAIAICLLSTSLLSGCSWMNSYKGADGHPATGPAPQVKIMQTADATWIKPTESNAVEHNVPAPNNADKDTMSRLSTLEHQVEAMQTDMNSMVPVLSQMVAVQTNIQTMLAHLQANGALPPSPETANSATNTPPPNGPAIPTIPLATSASQSPTAPPPLADHDTNANGAMNAQAATGDNAKSVDAPLAPLASAPPPPNADKMPTPVTPPPDKMAAASAAPTTLTAATPPMTANNVLATPPIIAPPPKDAPKQAGILIQDIRVGEHPGTTRIVLDVSSKVEFNNDLDNGEHILTIDVKDAGWKGPNMERKIDHSPLLVSWQTQADGQSGTRVIMQLSKTAKIASSQLIPSSNGEPARIVIDIAATN